MSAVILCASRRVIYVHVWFSKVTLPLAYPPQKKTRGLLVFVFLLAAALLPQYSHAAKETQKHECPKDAADDVQNGRRLVRLASGAWEVYPLCGHKGVVVREEEQNAQRKSHHPYWSARTTMGR